MATVTIKAANEISAEQILSNVYASDPSASFVTTPEKKHVSGSVLTASWDKNDSTVTVSSGYYDESSISKIAKGEK